MTILAEHFPYVIRQRQLEMTVAAVKVLFVPKVGKTIPSGQRRCRSSPIRR